MVAVPVVRAGGLMGVLCGAGRYEAGCSDRAAEALGRAAAGGRVVPLPGVNECGFG
jgi:hypothetical protein